MSDLYKNFPDTHKTWQSAQHSVGQRREKGRIMPMPSGGIPPMSDRDGFLWQ